MVIEVNKNNFINDIDVIKLATFSGHLKRIEEGKVLQINRYMWLPLS